MIVIVVLVVFFEFIFSIFYLIKKEVCFYLKFNIILMNEKSCFDGELIFILVVFFEFVFCIFYFNKKKYFFIKNLI